MLSRLPLLLLLPALVTACGKSNPTGPDKPDPDKPGAVSGKIDDAAWTGATTSTVIYTGSNRTYVFSAVETRSGGRAVTMTLSDISGPGTYQLGTGLPFRYANVVINSNVWETNVLGEGGAGQVVLTVASDSRIKGTMTWTGVPAPGSPTAAGTVTVNLSFDLPVMTTLEQ